MAYETLRNQRLYKAMKIVFVSAFLAAEAVGLYHAYSYFLPPACVHAKPPCAVPLVAFSSRLVVTRLLEAGILIALAFWSIKTIFFRLILGKNKEATILLFALLVLILYLIFIPTAASYGLLILSHPILP